MQTKKLNSLQALNPALISTSMKPAYRPRYKANTFTLSELQRRAYNKLLHGLRAFTPEELKNLNEEDKRSIVYTSNYAWQIINKLKQEKLNAFLNKILNDILPLCGDAAPILTAPITDTTFIVDRNIRECNVSEEVITREFVRKGLLPANFLAA